MIIIIIEKELTATKTTWLVFETVTARTLIKALTLQKSSYKYFWFLKFSHFKRFSFSIIIIILISKIVIGHT